MPTYVYACSSCDKSFEFEQRIVENAITTCQLCGTEGSIKRVIQPVGIAFKGSGFYVNDSVAVPKAATEEKKAEVPAEPSTDKPSEAPAATPTPAPAAESKSETPAAVPSTEKA